MITICESCKLKFNIPPSTIKRGSGKYCSRKCYWKKLRKGTKTERKCEVCGKIKHVSPSRIKVGKGRYCSKKCWQNSRTEVCVCLKCGKKYKHLISQLGYKYCSLKCLYELNEAKKKTIKCLFCGKKLKVRLKRIQDKRGKYCSKKCADAGKIKPEKEKHERRIAYTRKYRTENHDWYIAIKHKRRAIKNKLGGHFTQSEWNTLKKAHNNYCVGCGKKEPKIKLTADHRIPPKHWKEQSKILGLRYKWNDIGNIQPLCGNCNSRKWQNLQIKR